MLLWSPYTGPFSTPLHLPRLVCTLSLPASFALDLGLYTLRFCHTALQVSVLGPFANSPEMLLGNYYGTPAGPVTTPFEAIKVSHQPMLHAC